MVGLFTYDSPHIPGRCLLQISPALRPIRVALLLLGLIACSSASAQAGSVCDADALQASGSIYRICMPTDSYNGILVVWAHGFQDAGTPVSIPNDQLCTNGFCLYDTINDLGFAFATNSYSKTGLAVRQGQADLIDLVDIFVTKKGKPAKVYLVGASEGGLITALNLEQRPDVFSAGVAACGPVGDFPFTINYFGNARATFQYFFPELIPGNPFVPDASLTAMWKTYYEDVVRPAVFDPVNRHRLDQWVAVARLPYDADNYLETVEVSVRDALRYSVVNINDAGATLGGMPFENRYTWYSGSDNDILLNIFAPRIGAAPAAIAEMQAHYNTTGVLTRPLMTLHTLRDQQVPYLHEQIYNLKTLFAGSLITRHLNFPVDRFGHCNFTLEDALFAFGVMLLYDGVLDVITGTASVMTEPELASFERRAQATGLPYKREGATLKFKLKRP
jgi:pimeloyl-ACP methyl ester carboxylesterase